MVCDSNIETSLKTYSNIINGFMGNITYILNINSYLVTYHWKVLLTSKKVPRQGFYEITRQNRILSKLTSFLTGSLPFQTGLTYTPTSCTIVFLLQQGITQKGLTVFRPNFGGRLTF